MENIIKVICYSTKKYDIETMNLYRKKFNMDNFNIEFCPDNLGEMSVRYAKGASAILCFVNDDLSEGIMNTLGSFGIKLICMRCAGFDRVCIETAKKYNITVARVPRYSPEAVSEFCLALALSVIRRVPHAYERCKQRNFSLVGQMGFNIFNKTVGIIGTGFIGGLTAKIFRNGFRANVIVYDTYPSEQMKKEGFQYVELDELYKRSHIISLHIPLLPSTKRMFRKETFEKMKDGVVIVNTSRGGLIDIPDLIQALKNRKVGGAALDVYENESNLFFEDRSCELVVEDNYSILASFPNVVLTGHQAYFTEEAMEQITCTTYQNLAGFFQNNISSIEQNIVC